MYSDKYYFEKWVEFPPISAKGIFDKVSPPKLRNIRNYTPFIEKIKRKAEVYEVFTQLERAFNSIYSDETFEIVKETGWIVDFIKIIFNYFMMIPTLLKMFDRQKEAQSMIAEAEKKSDKLKEYLPLIEDKKQFGEAE